jgi:diketogulonate reductase-like aldo/keto reductase
MSGIRSKLERKMATQNPNRLRTNCPGGSLTLGGDTTVNRLGFGAMRLCGPGVWGEPLDRPGAKRVLMRAIELGITLVDTADAYGPEVNERFIAETLYPYPKDLIIATKGGLRRPRREAWENNGRPEHLRAACEASLRRLKLERIDIYQLHAPDPQVPLDEAIEYRWAENQRERLPALAAELVRRQVASLGLTSATLSNSCTKIRKRIGEQTGRTSHIRVGGGSSPLRSATPISANRCFP